MYFQAIKQTGLRPTDYRFHECLEKFNSKMKAFSVEAGGDFKVDKETFKE